MRDITKYNGYGRGGSYTSRYGSRRTGRVKSILRLDKRILETMINQLIAAAVFALVLAIISNINIPLTVKIKDGAKWVVENNYDFKSKFESISKGISDGINRLKGVPVSANDSFGNADAVYANASVMIMPIDGKITSNFGVREKPSSPGTDEVHKGVDIAGAEGTPIRAALDGVVVKIEENTLIGRSVRLKHENGIETLYGHCSEILVNENAAVKQGDYIAKAGHTGNATASHVHFEVIKDGKQIDPLTVIGGILETK